MPDAETQSRPHAEHMPEFVTHALWHGLDVWGCAECPWDTVEGGPDDVFAHWLSRHHQPRTIAAVPAAPQEE